MRRALYIGRFQLFHKGHLDVVQHIDQASDIEEIIFAIGSSQYDHTNKNPYWPWANNPFTYEEREQIVTRSIDGVVTKPYQIHPVPDYHNYPRWFQHIKDNLPDFAVLYTSDAKEKEFFTEKGYEVRPIPIKHPYHAQILRERIYKGMEYESALTQGTLDVMEEVGGVRRIKMLFARDIAESIKF